MYDNLLKAEKQSHVVHTKDPLSLAIESIMVSGNVMFSTNNRRDKIKNSLQNDSHFLCEMGILLSTCFLGEYFPENIRKAREVLKLTTYHSLS